MLQEAITTNTHQLLKRLVDLGGDINVRNRKGHSLLHRACFWGYLECAKKLVQLNPAMLNDQMNDFCVTPLMVAIANERVEIVRFLIAAGAQKNLLAKWNKTSFDIAILTLTRNIDRVVADECVKDNIFYIIGLLSPDVHIQESDTNIRIKGEMTAFRYMEEKKNQEMLSIFRQHSFGINVVNDSAIFGKIIEKIDLYFGDVPKNRSGDVS